MSAGVAQQVDLFCRVIDNYGDIGVCWRLARQLLREHGYAVRLWVDDLASFQRLCPAVDCTAALQMQDGLSIVHWAETVPDIRPGDLVIEGFACRLPERFLHAMAARSPRPVWVNLDYLSAEDWVAGCHGLPSPHPRLPLQQFFFFPGFGPQTGGLLREADLLIRRDALQADSAAQNRVWQQLGLPPRHEDELRISLFSYETPALPGLLAQWQNEPRTVRCLVPEGRALEQLRVLLEHPLPVGSALQHGKLTLHALPFLAHEAYDQLLWMCDLNIVRGEDSFVRALWAARPLLWHIYAQEEDVHLDKLHAFLTLYLAAMPAPLAAAVQALWLDFNSAATENNSWHSVAGMLQAWQEQARRWSSKLELQQDLASQLVKFHQDRVQSRVS